MRKWIGATAVSVALVSGVVGVPAALAVNDFGAVCAYGGDSSFVAPASTRGTWYAYAWRSGYVAAGYGYVWVPASGSPTTVDNAFLTGATYKGGSNLTTPTDPTDDGQPLKFGVVRGKYSTKYSYLDCT